MNKFKKGDIVTPSGLSKLDLTMGKTYEVAEDSTDVLVRLKRDDVDENISRQCWFFDLAETKYPNPKHPHHDLIIEWAKGADIQYLSELSGNWLDTTRNGPVWDKITKYRIKPTEGSKLTKTQRIEQLERRVRELEGKQ